MELSKAIKERRSIRRFLKGKIDDNDLVPVIEAAVWAPSAGNIQDKFFLIVKDDKLKKGIAQACFEQVWIANAPVILIMVSDLGKLSRFGERADFYASISAGAAIQNVLLMLTDKGFQGTEVGLFDELMIKRLLKIPLDNKIFAVIPLGKPAEKPPAPRKQDIKPFVYFDEWGRKWFKDKPKIVFEK